MRPQENTIEYTTESFNDNLNYVKDEEAEECKFTEIEYVLELGCVLTIHISHC